MFDGLERQIAQLLKLLMEKGPYQAHFSELANSLFISDTRAGGGDKEGICGGGASNKLFQCESVSMGLFRSSGIVVGVGETPSRGMGPQGKSLT